MKLLKKAAYAIVFTAIFVSTFQCANSKEIATTTFEEQAPFKVKSVYFQEWYAGIKVGGTGINIFLPITDVAENVEIDRVYFRNLTGKLIKKDGNYISLLKNKSPNYTFKKAEASIEYPFTLSDNECAISYIENGKTKYLKIVGINELAGIYYENGPPSIYFKGNSAAMVSLNE